MHPVLYVFLGGARCLAHEIQARAQEVHPCGGVFFLSLPEGEGDTRRAAITVKARIQQNEAGLNLKRVYIYIVAQGHRPEAGAGLQSFANTLRTVFAEDFTVPDLSLCVLLRESLEPSDRYEARASAISRLLSNLAEASALYDRVFLLSDRNETGALHPAHWPLIYEAVARLPLTHSTPSRLYGMLDAKKTAEGRPLFLSAGINPAEALPPSEADPSVANAHPPEAVPTAPIPDHVIIGGIQSVAARPLNIFHFYGLTLAEAEAALFGDGAARFFESNYLSRCGAGAIAPCPDDNALSHQIALLSHRLETALAAPCKAWHVAAIKRKIAGAYALRYRLHLLQAAQAARTRQNEAERAKEERTRQGEARYRESLSRLRTAPMPPCAISLVRYDGLLREDFIFAAADCEGLFQSHHTHFIPAPGAPCVLRVLGGFPMEALTRHGVLQ
jgi:hypothetical protein